MTKREKTLSSENKLRTILALETSCDETACAIVHDGRHVLASTLVSQTDIHARYGGVVPEVAARHHVESVNDLIMQCMKQAGLRPDELDAIACTSGPGLIGTLLVGLSAAKSLSWSWNLPLIPVDHLFAHVCANYIDSDLQPPFICLLVSGGHTQIMRFDTFSDWTMMGQTLDDAAGEAFDKVARLLELGYPGGPAIDRLARQGRSDSFAFPEGSVPGFDFSFSGLKTAVLRTTQKLSAHKNDEREAELPKEDISASFQDAVNRVLVAKTVNAAKQSGIETIVLAGGVAANSDLRARFKNIEDLDIHLPNLAYCTDNAAMVAAAAFFAPSISKLDVCAYSRSPFRKKSR